MMNNAVQIFRRLLTFRGCNRIISSGYCDGGKVNSKSNRKKLASHDTSDAATDSSQVKEPNQVESKASSTTISETQATSSETMQQLEDKKLSVSSTNDLGKSDTERRGGSLAPGEENIEVTSNTERKEAGGSEIEKNKRRKADTEPGGFFAAYKEQEKLRQKQLRDESSSRSTETFASLFRKSPFVDMGDPTGKVVVGEVFLVVDNDLYIDFGWKFHAVCSKPKRNPDHYVAGARVFLRINDLELHARFLGEKSYVSLLEADCELIGIALVKEKDPRTMKKGKSPS